MSTQKHTCVKGKNGSCGAVLGAKSVFRTYLLNSSNLTD